MSPEITWQEITFRLAVSLLAGAVLGANRGEQGRPAGLRTTILVCLTASASMILANLLLDTAGKAWDSFAAMDVMRLPLGILTGMGFIGAGAILHKGSLVVGVTTAATLWLTTMMGFCLGAGETGLGLAMLGLGVFVLWCLEWVEKRWKQRKEATLVLAVSLEGTPAEALLRGAVTEGYCFDAPAVKRTPDGEESVYSVSWYESARQKERPSFLADLCARPEVRRVEWTPLARS